MVLNFNMQPNYDCKHFVKQTNFKPFLKKQFFSGHFVLYKGFKNKTVLGTRESRDEKKKSTKLKDLNVITAWVLSIWRFSFKPRLRKFSILYSISTL